MKALCYQNVTGRRRVKNSRIFNLWLNFFSILKTKYVVFQKGAVDPPTYEYKIGQTLIISGLQPRVAHTQMIIFLYMTIVLSLKIQQHFKINVFQNKK